MSFKDIISNDISKVFMNTEEYADKARINGKMIAVVVDNEHLTHTGSQQELDGSDGDIFYFVSKADWLEKFGKLPKAYEAQEFNKLPCTVVKVGDTNGVLDITLAYSRG
jgi:hypothetical protein